ncbi:MAG: hypothetical protein ACLPPF_11320 [Rhodomicrobium sp.]
MTRAVDDTNLHRTAKYFMDNGRAETHEDAVRLLQSFGLSIRIDARTAATVNGQVALLTLVNAARRTFLAGIEVQGLPNIPLIAPLASAGALSAAVAELGGRLVSNHNQSWPVALIGDGDNITTGAPIWRLCWSGWRGGVTPARLGKMPTEESAIPLASSIAAAACIAEAFAYHAGDHPMAGRRSAGMSLWMPGRDWLDEDSSEPKLSYLPSRLWLIGMGNLGQAFAWLLAALPYADRQVVEFVLQDFDCLAISNDSTSLLSTLRAVGQKKGRSAAAWLDARGFSTILDEHRFGEATRRGPGDPSAAFCGVDNALARMALEKAGFDLVVEAGLGAGPDGFRNFAIHTFPGERSAESIWSRFAQDTHFNVEEKPAYKALRARGMDACGLTQLASRTVGVPFVGLTAAALALSELLRRLHGGSAFSLISGSMMALEDVEAFAMKVGPYAHGHVPVAS